MRVATRAEAQALDARAQSESAISAESLMEAAGSLSAREVEQTYFNEVKNGRVIVLCGFGHNGGDGFVLARHLSSKGAAVEVVFVGDALRSSELARTQRERCVNAGLVVHESLNESKLKFLFAHGALVVDAVFGLGFHGEIRNPERLVFKALSDSVAARKRNSKPLPVVALDVPSGLDVDTGLVAKDSVRAELTLTFGVAKRGFFVSEGPSHVGRVKVLAIGYPDKLLKEICSTHTAVTGEVARKLLPVRKSSSNKSSFGHCAIFAGRSGMWGAALLAAGSAFRVGSGYVTLICSEPSEALMTAMPEVLTSTVDEALVEDARWKVAGIGPGYGVGSETERVLKFLREHSIPAVVDADALTTLANSRDPKFSPHWILTPHAGELAKLLGVTSKEIEADRFRYAREAADRFGCVVLLKGYRTVIANPGGGKTRVVLSGNVALAKAGTGDVLTGMITGLLAQGLDLDRAASLGVYLHGRISEEWRKTGRDLAGLQASDVRDALPQLMLRLRQGADA